MPLPPYISDISNLPVGAVSPRESDRLANEAYLSTDLRSVAVEINGVVLPKEIGDAYKALAAFVYDRKAFNITLQSGFMSRYTLLQELVGYIKPNAATGSLQTAVALLPRPEAFENYLKIPSNITNLEAAIEKLPKNDFTIGDKAFRKFTVTNKHPYLQANTILYGVPNYPSIDPRRVGNFFILNEISDDIFIFLINNASDYGFIWYGVDKRYWLYNGAIVKAKSDKLKQAFDKLATTSTNILTDLFI